MVDKVVWRLVILTVDNLCSINFVERRFIGKRYCKAEYLPKDLMLNENLDNWDLGKNNTRVTTDDHE